MNTVSDAVYECEKTINEAIEKLSSLMEEKIKIDMQKYSLMKRVTTEYTNSMGVIGVVRNGNEDELSHYDIHDKQTLYCMDRFINAIDKCDTLNTFDHIQLLPQDTIKFDKYGNLVD